MATKVETIEQNQHCECGPLTEAEYERINTAFDRLLDFEKSMSHDTRDRIQYGRRIQDCNRLRNEAEQAEFWAAIQHAELKEVWIAMPERWDYPLTFDDLVTYSMDNSLRRMRMFDAFEKLIWQPGWRAQNGRVYVPLYWNGTVVENAIAMTEGERNRIDSLARKDRIDFNLALPSVVGPSISLLEKAAVRKTPSLPEHPIFGDLGDIKYDELFNELADWDAFGGKLRCPYTNGDLVNLKKLPLPLLSERPNAKLAEWFINNKKEPLTASGLGKTQGREGGKIFGIVQRTLKLLNTSE